MVPLHVKPVGVILLPVPAVPAHILNAVLRFPAEFFIGLSRIRIAGVNISGTPALDDVRNFKSVCSFKGLHHVQHRVTNTGAQVKDLDAAVFLNGLQCLDMTLCQINHMDIVADAGSVRCVIVVSEYVQLLQLSNGNLRDIRHQVVRNTVRIFTDQAGSMRTDWI